VSERIQTHSVSVPNPAGSFYVVARFPLVYKLRQTVGLWLLELGYRVGGFKGLRLEQVES
jgi:hypothetical protein